MKLGANGLLYIAGSTDTQQLVGFGDSYNPLSAGLTDIFIAILDTNTAGFNLIYFSYLGGSALDIPLAIDVDGAGALYMTGTTTSTDFPIAGAAVQTTGAASTVDAFVLKLDFSKGGKDSLVYSTYLGCTDGSESGNGIAVGPDGMIYVIGDTRSTDFPVTGGTAFLPVKWGLQDAFLSKIDPNGGLVYSTYMGGEGTEWGRAIAVGKTGLVYFAVSTLSQLYPAAGYSLNGTPHEFGQEVAVGVMDMTLSGIPSLLYSTFLGGSNNEEVRALALDARENIVVAGYTISTDFPITADAMQRQNLGNADLFVSVIDPKTGPAGLVYSTYLGGAHGDVPYDVKVDAAGSIYVTGYTLSSDFPVTPDGVQPQWGVGTNMFVAKLKPNVAGRDALQYGTFLGSSGTYVPQAIAVKTDGTIFVAGYASRGLPSSEIAFQPAFAGGASDGFVLVIGK